MPKTSSSECVLSCARLFDFFTDCSCRVSPNGLVSAKVRVIQAVIFIRLLTGREVVLHKITLLR